MSPHGNSSDRATRLKELIQHFDFSAKQLETATEYFVKQLNDGLERDGAPMPQIPSFVTKLPTGTEKGVCLSVDLGGTNLRICSVELLGNSRYSVTQDKCMVPRHLMTASTYTDLFDFIARQMQDFLAKYRKEDLEGESKTRNRTLPVGFTFSFTFDQHSINEGALLVWDKAYNIPDAIGRDPCKMLQEAFDRLDLPVRIVALANDTVGTLVARSYCASHSSSTLLGAIFGTGTNGAYMEKISKIKKLHHLQDRQDVSSDGLMALNTEWGAFDDELLVLPKTSFDESLDRESVNPGRQMFEKRVSGMYLGEILRQVLLSMAEGGQCLLDMQILPDSPLYSAYSIDSPFLSLAAGDTSHQHITSQKEIERLLNASAVSNEDAEAVCAIAKAIGRRAARLAAVSVAGVIIQSGQHLKKPLEHRNNFCGLWATIRRVFGYFFGGVLRWSPWRPQWQDLESGSQSSEVIDIGVDGSLIEHFPGFEEHLREALREIPEIGSEVEARVRIGLAKDGSGVGAAMIAWSSQ